MEMRIYLKVVLELMLNMKKPVEGAEKIVQIREVMMEANLLKAIQKLKEDKNQVKEADQEKIMDLK